MCHLSHSISVNLFCSNGTPRHRIRGNERREGKVTDVSEELKAGWSSLVEIDQLWSLSLAWEHILEHEHPLPPSPLHSTSFASWQEGGLVCLFIFCACH